MSQPLSTKEKVLNLIQGRPSTRGQIEVALGISASSVSLLVKELHSRDRCIHIGSWARMSLTGRPLPIFHAGFAKDVQYDMHEVLPVIQVSAHRASSPRTIRQRARPPAPVAAAGPYERDPITAALFGTGVTK